MNTDSSFTYSLAIAELFEDYIISHGYQNIRQDLMEWYQLMFGTQDPKSHPMKYEKYLQGYDYSKVRYGAMIMIEKPMVQLIINSPYHIRCLAAMEPDSWFIKQYYLSDFSKGMLLRLIEETREHAEPYVPAEVFEINGNYVL